MSSVNPEPTDGKQRQLFHQSAPEANCVGVRAAPDRDASSRLQVWPLRLLHGSSLSVGYIDPFEGLDCFSKLRLTLTQDHLKLPDNLMTLDRKAVRLGVITFTTCANSVLATAPISAVPQSLRDQLLDSIHVPVRLHVANGGRMPAKNGEAGSDSWSSLEIHWDGFISQKNGVRADGVDRIFFRYVDEAPAGHAPDGMMHCLDIEIRPREENPAQSHGAAALINHGGYVPIAEADLSQSTAHLHLLGKTVALYLPCKCMQVGIV